MKSLVQACLCAFLFAATFAALEIGTTVLELRADLSMTAANLSAVAVNAVAAEKQVKIAAEQQRLYWKVYGKQIEASLKSTNALIKNTDESLNGKTGVLPQVSSTTELLAASSIQLSTRGMAALDEATEALHNTSRAALAASVLVEKATPPAVNTLAHVDATTASIAHVTDHYDAVLTAPQTTWQKIKSAIWFPIKVAVKVW